MAEVPDPNWQHPPTEAERLAELEGFLARDFELFPQVRIECQFLLDSYMSCRVDLLAMPKAFDFEDVVLAFEVKRERFDLERALKQSADYVGGRIVEGANAGKRIGACFLYPAYDYKSWFQLIAQWRVGRGYMKAAQLRLAIGFEIIWDSGKGWHTTVANRMLLSKRTAGGSRKDTHLTMNRKEAVAWDGAK